MRLVETKRQNGEFVRYFLEDRFSRRLILEVNRTAASLIEVIGDNNYMIELCKIDRVNFSDSWQKLYVRCYERLEFKRNISFADEGVERV